MRTSLETARVFLRVDVSSPSGLRWIKKPWKGTVKSGDPAGYLAPKDKYGYGPVWIVKVAGTGENASRLVWLLTHGEIPAGMHVDHMNGIPSDNRIENLSLKTSGHNVRARHKKNCRNTSGYNGVTWSKKKKRWKAIFQRNGKEIHIGSAFRSAEEAGRAVDKAAREWAEQNNEEHRLFNFSN